MSSYTNRPVANAVYHRGWNYTPDTVVSDQKTYSIEQYELEYEPKYHTGTDEGSIHSRLETTSYNQALLSSTALTHSQPSASASGGSGNPSSASAAAGTWSKPSKGSALFHWKIEVLLAIVIVALLIAVSFTLAWRQEQLLPRWPLKITLNTLLSVYAVLIKTAILYIVTAGLGQLKWLWYTKTRPLAHFEIFDAASRGPWGSLQMLWSIHFRSVAAALGALIVIVSLAVDPFIQQIVQLYPCSTYNLTSNASISRTNYFDGRGGHITAGIDGIDPGMQGFINAGLFAPTSVSIPFDCPTGNCTFGSVYHTVSYCSSCTNVTDSLTLDCAAIDQNDTLPGAATGQNCSYEFPATYSGESGAQLANVSADLSTGSSLFTSYMTSDGAVQLIWNFADVQAAQCSFDPCIKSYNSTVVGGNLTEQFVKETKIEGSTQATLVRLDCLSDAQKQTLRQQGYLIENDTDWLPYNGTNTTSSAGISLDDLVAQPNNAVPVECMYSMHPLSANSITHFLAGYFSGTLRQAGTGASSYQDQPIGPAQLGVMYNSSSATVDSIAANLGGVADGITTYIRQNGNISLSSPALGLIQLEQTCTHVRWEWLSLPAALALATIVFLIMTMFAASRQRVGQDWKLSQYPLFFHGFDQATLDHTQNLDQLKDMEERGKTLQVRIIAAENGLKFAEAHVD